MQNTPAGVALHYCVPCGGHLAKRVLVLGPNLMLNGGGIRVAHSHVVTVHR